MGAVVGENSAAAIDLTVVGALVMTQLAPLRGAESGSGRSTLAIGRRVRVVGCRLQRPWSATSKLPSQLPCAEFGLDAHAAENSFDRPCAVTTQSARVTCNTTFWTISFMLMLMLHECVTLEMV